MNPWALLGAVLAAASATVSAYFYGVGIGKDQCTATALREEKIGTLAAEAAASAAAAAISTIEVKNVYNEKQIVREVRTNTVYATCVHTPDGLRAVNAALANRRAEPTSGGVVPPAVGAR